MVLTTRPSVVRTLDHSIRRRGVGQPLEHDVGACHSVAQTRRHPHQLIPLFAE
jgi:hypothetical protein